MTTKEFTEKVGATLCQGFTATGIAMGTKLGLFKALADLSQSKETSVTTQQLADSMKFKERYVREWIRGMACGGVVDHEEIEGTDRYWLEPYRLPVLLGDTIQWPAVFTELLTCLVPKVPVVEKCFPLDGPPGTDAADYTMTHEWLVRRNVVWHTPENCKLMFADAPDLLNRLEAGLKVIELGGGGCNPTKAMATCFPKSSFIASDLIESNVVMARANCKSLSNVTCMELDVSSIPEDMSGQFDLVLMFDVYHDVPQPQKLIDGVLRLLKEGGQLFINEMNNHESVTDNKNNLGFQSAAQYMLSTLYCVPTCLNTPGAEGLGACGGKELYERRFKQDFADVKIIAEQFGLHFLCTK